MATGWNAPLLINCKIIATHSERTSICIPCRSQWNLHRSQWNMHLRWLEYASEVIGCQSDGILYNMELASLVIGWTLRRNFDSISTAASPLHLCGIYAMLQYASPSKTCIRPSFWLVVAPTNEIWWLTASCDQTLTWLHQMCFFWHRARAFASLQNFLACF